VIDDPARVELAVLRAGRAVRHAFSTRLKAIGLTMTEASLLSYVDDHGSLTQRELADLLKITPASTGSAIDGLVRRKLVERQADPGDRRVWRVVLTPQAAPFVAEFRRVDTELRTELRFGMARSERQLLARLLSVLEENAAISAGDRPLERSSNA
jgi:MarR family transcriptional regulator for hemolysin